MNCKQGDLAIVIKSIRGNEGKIVTCLKHFISPYTGNDCWITDTKLCPNGVTEHSYAIKDAFLRPFRPSNEEDEMLRIVGKPEKVTI